MTRTTVSYLDLDAYPAGERPCDVFALEPYGDWFVWEGQHGDRPVHHWAQASGTHVRVPMFAFRAATDGPQASVALAMELAFRAALELPGYGRPRRLHLVVGAPLAAPNGQGACRTVVGIAAQMFVDDIEGSTRRTRFSD